VSTATETLKVEGNKRGKIFQYRKYTWIFFLFDHTFGLLINPEICPNQHFLGVNNWRYGLFKADFRALLYFFANFLRTFKSTATLTSTVFGIGLKLRETFHGIQQKCPQNKICKLTVGCVQQRRKTCDIKFFHGKEFNKQVGAPTVPSAVI
jgi:hypothetical protein